MAQQMAVSFKYIVPARTGYAFEVKKGGLIRFTDLEGAQPIDFWAFNKADPLEYLSASHTRVWNGSLDVKPGQVAVTSKRFPIVTLVEDNSPGQHDMLFAACDARRYELLGVKGYHASCQENLHKALQTFGITLPFTPQPWNLFTNFPVRQDRSVGIEAPATKPGDNLVLRAEMDIVVAISACPQDQNPTCGGQPTPVCVELGHVHDHAAA